VHGGLPQKPDGIGRKDATPENAPLVLRELADTVKLEVEPDLLVSVRTKPVADAVTGDAESELKALLRLVAMVP
jgi:hypothetical protein